MDNNNDRDESAAGIDFYLHIHGDADRYGNIHRDYDVHIHIYTDAFINADFYRYIIGHTDFHNYTDADKPAAGFHKYIYRNNNKDIYSDAHIYMYLNGGAGGKRNFHNAANVYFHA